MESVSLLQPEDALELNRQRAHMVAELGLGRRLREIDVEDE
ncbi:hypothetical protein [Massilia sp. IC2-477]|nr:hypothetical protein [Massilia sp. IC2-477]